MSNTLPHQQSPSPITVDASELLDAFVKLVQRAPITHPLSPLIEVTCDGDSCVFGRETLATLGWARCCQQFYRIFRYPKETYIERRSEHYVEVPGNVYIEVLATFHSQDGVQPAPAARIDIGSWNELIMESVKSLEVTITMLKPRKG